MGACVSVGGDDSSHRPISNKAAQAFLQGERKRDEALAQLGSRVVTTGASKSSVLHTQQGRKGTNQDTMIVWEEYMAQEDVVFCGVFDGHGPFGHLVAKRVRDSLPTRLADSFAELAVAEAQVDARVAAPDGTVESAEGTQNEGPGSKEETAGDDKTVEVKKLVVGGEEWLSTWRDAHMKSYQAMDRELATHPTIDCFCSGTTSVTFMKIGRYVIASNVGDSRCIIGRRTATGGAEAHQVTIDLKPDLPAEAARIRQCRGRVFAMRDEPEVQRVWLPHDDSPGLAMARAFGDLCLKSYGVISEPKFYFRELTTNDLFALLATDGVWDVLSNQEVVDIVRSTPRERAARTVVEKANAMWRTKFPFSKTDDCAAVVLFFDNIPPPSEDTSDDSFQTSDSSVLARGSRSDSIPRVASDESTSTSISTPGDTNADSGDESLSVNDTLRLNGNEPLITTLRATVQSSSKSSPGNGDHSDVSVGDSSGVNGISEEKWAEDNRFTRANSFVNLSQRDRA